MTAVKNWAKFVSPRLGIRFELVDADLHVYGANGQRFLTFVEVSERAEQADMETKRAKREAKRADREAKRADDAVQLLVKLRAKMLAAGLDPDG